MSWVQHPLGFGFGIGFEDFEFSLQHGIAGR